MDELDLAQKKLSTESCNCSWKKAGDRFYGMSISVLQSTFSDSEKHQALLKESNTVQEATHICTKCQHWVYADKRIVIPIQEVSKKKVI